MITTTINNRDNNNIELLKTQDLTQDLKNDFTKNVKQNVEQNVEIKKLTNLNTDELFTIIKFITFINFYNNEFKNLIDIFNFSLINKKIYNFMQKEDFIWNFIILNFKNIFDLKINNLINENILNKKLKENFLIFYKENVKNRNDFFLFLKNLQKMKKIEIFKNKFLNIENFNPFYFIHLYLFIIITIFIFTIIIFFIFLGLYLDEFIIVKNYIYFWFIFLPLLISLFLGLFFVIFVTGYLTYFSEIIYILFNKKINYILFKKNLFKKNLILYLFKFCFLKDYKKNQAVKIWINLNLFFTISFILLILFLCIKSTVFLFIPNFTYLVAIPTSVPLIISIFDFFIRSTIGLFYFIKEDNDLFTEIIILIVIQIILFFAIYSPILILILQIFLITLQLDFNFLISWSFLFIPLHYLLTYLMILFLFISFNLIKIQKQNKYLFVTQLPFFIGGILMVMASFIILGLKLDGIIDNYSFLYSYVFGIICLSLLFTYLAGILYFPLKKYHKENDEKE